MLDAFVIFAYFAVVISIGLYKGRGDRSMEGFAIGNRSIPWWAVLASILAAEISAATFLGAPSEGYKMRNFTYAQLALGTILARVIIAFLFIKPYYDYRVVSIYEFLLVRFGGPTRNAASAVFLVTRALASGTRLYVAGVVLVLAYGMYTGHPLAEQRLALQETIAHATDAAAQAQAAAQLKALNWQEVGIYIGALSILTIVTALYTALGGIKAVVWTDVIQATIMFGSLGFAIGLLVHQTPGGWGAAWGEMKSAGYVHFFETGTVAGQGFWLNVRSVLESEYTIWAALLGSTFLTMATHGTDQDMVQRMLTAKDHTRSRLALILSGLADFPIAICFLLVGVLLWIHYRQPEMKDVFSQYILREMPSGIRGLLIAGIFATAMGSLSTALNALATSFTEDWYRAHFHPRATEAEVIRAARLSTVVFSILLIAIGSLTAYAVIMLHTRIIPIVLGIFGYTYGSLLGIFLVGMLTRRRGSNRGNLIAMLCGFIVVALLSGLHTDLAILVGLRPELQPGERPWPGLTIEFPWRILFGTVVTAGIAACFRTPVAQLDVVKRHLEEASAPR